ncbi:MAG TPA: AsmA family protein [Terracidiphilus sp.]|nr:AsmA family protein [Terracidiphilus sp.]
MKKRWVKITVASAAAILILILVAPFLVNADTFRPTIASRLSTALGRPVSLGHLTFSLLRGSLVANDISIADDSAFSNTPFLQAKSFSIGVEVLPLLFHHSLHITRLAVDSPSIHLIHADNGRWNFSSLGVASSNTSTQKSSALPNLTVGKLEIKDGSATVSTLPAVGNPFVYSGINLTVRQLSFIRSFPFELSAKLPGSGSLRLTGSAGPLNQVNAADTPFNASFSLKNFDPVASGVVEPSTGIGMNVDLNAQLASDGSTLTSSGSIQAAHLKLARTGAPSPQPVHIDFAVTNNLAARAGRVSNLTIHAGSVAAQVTGGFQLQPHAVLLSLHLAAPNLPIDQLEKLLPAFGVTLPSGSSLKGGTLTANLAISGPATATSITGPVEIDNTKLAGFDLGSKIQGLSPFGGTGQGTDIQTLRTTVSSTPQITQFSSIYGNLPQLGTATGSGTVTPAGNLNFQMVATLSSKNAVGAAANQAVNTVSNFVGGFFHPNSKPAASTANRGIPLTITGTAKSPSIRANLRAMLK